MKKKYIVVMVLGLLLASCASSRPIYNEDKESLAHYQKRVQKYYQQQNK